MTSIAHTRKLPPWRLIVTNYIGGLGYYAWHFAWILTVFFAAIRTIQYLIFGGEPLLYTPAQTTQTAATPSAETNVVVAIFVGVLAIIFCVAVVVFVTCLPYLIGYLSKDIPRWCLRQTSRGISIRTLYYAKLFGVVCALVCAVPILYYPGASASMNIGFFIVVATCVLALLCFWLQHICVTLWRIPERRVF